MTTHISKTFLLSALAMGLAGWQPANAGFAKDDFVTMGDQSVMQMASADGFSGEHRAWLAQDALDNALVLATDRTPSAVTIGKENGAVTIVLDGRRVATVDANSADRANLSVDALAQQWAQSLRDFLSDSDRTAAYVASLKNNQLVKAEVALLERTMYAPAGMSFQVKLTNAISNQTVKVGDIVEGTIAQDVAMGHYVIPAGAIVMGTVIDGENDSYSIRFQSIKTASGRVFPIEGVVTDEFVISSKGPHRVCTYVIPSGMANGVPLVAGRISAGIGIGTIDTDGLHVLVFRRNTADTLVVGKVLYMQLVAPTPVVVVMRGHAM